MEHGEEHIQNWQTCIIFSTTVILADKNYLQNSVRGNGIEQIEFDVFIVLSSNKKQLLTATH